ncbi:MAG: hypothetical protein FJX75_21340 [Armatimonadetes bacterium]|nr:hypothetical protein [Armatimonadota bacterium]
MVYRQLLRYNARICTGLGPWLIVVPVAATMLVLFALMAMTSLIREATPVLILETLGPILMAFVGVNLLRPEYQYNALETVLTRPVSFRVILTVRVFLGALAVLALQALLALFMQTVMHKPFSAGAGLLAAGASMVFLTALAVAVAAAWRSPTFGFVAAAAFWVLDLLLGPSLNPLFTLRGYSAHLAQPEAEFGAWVWGKLAVLVAGLILIVLAGKAAARPAIQRSVRRYVQTAVALTVILVAYTCTGVVYKVRWGEAHEEQLLNHSRLYYRTALQPYGPLPVAYLLGPAFPPFTGRQGFFVKASSGSATGLVIERGRDIEQLKVAAFGYPNSRWADNALYELGRLTAQDPGSNEGDARFSVQCLEQLVTQYPSSPFAPPALERLSATYAAAGRLQEARAAVDRLLDAYPGSLSAMDAGRELLMKLTDPSAPGGANLPDALTVVGKLVQAAKPDDRPEFLLQQGLILSDPTIARNAEAIAALQQADSEAAARVQATASVQQPDADVINLLRDMGDIRRRAKEALQRLRAR